MKFKERVDSFLLMKSALIFNRDKKNKFFKIRNAVACKLMRKGDAEEKKMNLRDVLSIET